MTRTRRDVWSLSKVDVWEETLLWYAKAVREMQTRPLDDPRSWRYQAAIHEFNGDGSPAEQPADKDIYWDQCQHHCWFFLPWHRWYLLYFEEVVAETVVALGGPADWSLPYWNYSDTSNADARRLAPAFRERQLPDGSPNPLRIEERTSGNGGGNVGSVGAIDLVCLEEPRYQADPPGGRAGFGGVKVKFNNHRGGTPGVVEQTPHGSMHGAVGGFMGAFDTAGLDPLFWLHHCNIDRLWEVWRQRDARHLDPVDPDWLDNLSFPFHDGTGAAVTKTVRGVVNTVAIGYEYEDVSDPLAAFEGVAPKEAPMAMQRIPEMVGASEHPVQLGRAPATTQVEMTAPTGPAAPEAVSLDMEPPRIIVTLENVTGDGTPKNYSVYVNDVYAGLLPTFGVPEATHNDKHSGSGLEYRFDVTDIVRLTQADPGNLRVTFIPEEQEPEEKPEGAPEAVEPAPNFQVGRVSVYLS
ncbi:MAG: tyrosinase family protein [Acidobacteriota bacterium]